MNHKNIVQLNVIIHVCVQIHPVLFISNEMFKPDIDDRKNVMKTEIIAVQQHDVDFLGGTDA